MLALAAMMENHGQLYATDTDKRRLAPIHERLAPLRRAQRAGAYPALGGRCARRPRRRADLVLIDALHRHRHLAAQSRRQVAGTSRAPQAAQKEQAAVLDRAAALVQPASLDVTCSLLAEENDQVNFARQDFAPAPPASAASARRARYLFRRASCSRRRDCR